MNERGETEYREENLDDQAGIFLLESEFRERRVRRALVYVASFQIITSVNVDSRRRYYGLRFDAAISRPFAANEAHAAAVASKRMPW